MGNDKSLLFPCDTCKANEMSPYLFACETSPSGIAIVASTGKFLYVNKAYCAILGYSADELKERDFQSVTHPDDLAMDVDLVKKCLAGEIDTYELKKRYIRKDGSPISVTIYISCLRKETEAQIVFSAHCKDLTAEQKQYVEFKESQKKLHLSNLNTQQGFWDWDIPSGRLTFSLEYRKLLGYEDAIETAPDSFGTSMAEIHPEDQGKVLKALKESLESNIPYDVEARFRLKNGTYRWFRSRAEAERDVDGKPLRMSGFINDITEDRQRRMSLIAAMNEIKNKNEELEQFAYIASHDLQEPLRTVSSYVQLFATKYKDVVDEKGQKYINFILEANGRMRNLIKDLLEYSRFGNPTAKEITDFHTIMKDVKMQLAAKIKLTKTKISYDTDQNCNIFGNYNEILRVFQNIISNSIKFAKPGIQPVIKITCETVDNMSVFSIKDNGIGIIKENSKNIFKMFYRIGQTSGKQNEGNGMGLAICKKIVEKHGGTIELDSEIEKGTTIKFSFYNSKPNEKT